MRSCRPAPGVGAAVAGTSGGVAMRDPELRRPGRHPVDPHVGVPVGLQRRRGRRDAGADWAQVLDHHLSSLTGAPAARSRPPRRGSTLCSRQRRQPTNQGSSARSASARPDARTESLALGSHQRDRLRGQRHATQAAVVDGIGRAVAEDQREVGVALEHEVHGLRRLRLGERDVVLGVRIRKDGDRPRHQGRSGGGEAAGARAPVGARPASASSSSAMSSSTASASARPSRTRPGSVELHAPRAAESRAQPVAFEGPQVLADGGLGPAERPGGRADRSRPGRLPGRSAFVAGPPAGHKGPLTAVT